MRAVTWDSVYLLEKERAREVWCRPLQTVAGVLLFPLFLPSCLLSCCKLNAPKRCCRLCLSHSLIRSLCPFSSRLLPLSHSLAESPYPLTSSHFVLLSSSSYITDNVQVSCCNTVSLRAVCSQRRGFPARAFEVGFTVGNTIHHASQAPPSPAIILPYFSHWLNM